MDDELMEDWVAVKLKDIFEVVTGNTPSKSDASNYGSDIPFVKPPNLWNGTVTDTKEFLTESGAEKSRIIPPFSTLVTCIGTLGRVGINKNIVAFNQQINAIKPCQNVDSFFTFYQLQNPNFKLQLERASSATTVAIVNKGNFETLDFHLPPLPIQRAIVSKIETLFSDLDNGIADLKKAQEQLKIYRQAVLKKAFEGKLTHHNLSYGKLPKGWKWKMIKEVCINIKVGIVIKPTNFYSPDSTGIPAFRSANVREFQVNDSKWVYFTKEGNEINKRTQLNEGDVLIVRTGYPGTSCVVPSRFVGSNAIDILIATPDCNIITSKYLCAFNNSPLGKGLFSAGSRGVAQKHLNVGVYSKLKISIPPVEEQHQIVREIESRLSVCDKVEESIKQGLEKAQPLRQSILKKAFEGKLLSSAEIEKCKTEDDYEPASVLLERIRSERASG